MVSSANNAKATEASDLQTSLEQAKKYLITSGKKVVYFETSSGTTDMNIIPVEYVNKLKFYLDNHPEVKINVVGHTDNSGPEAFNKHLGTLRAEFVKSFLVKSGVNADQIQTSSMSYSEPAATNNTPEGRSKNRRAEINVLI